MRFWIMIATMAIIRATGHIDNLDFYDRLFLVLFGIIGIIFDLIEFKEKIK